MFLTCFLNPLVVLLGSNHRKTQYAQYSSERALCSKPRDLFQLWEEFEFGIGGRKAAKRFSTRERGRVKYKYHRRKVVWDKIQELIRRGHTHHTAIDEILRTYGEDKTVTEIINLMRRDRMAPIRVV